MEGPEPGPGPGEAREGIVAEIEEGEPGEGLRDGVCGSELVPGQIQRLALEEADFDVHLHHTLFYKDEVKLDEWMHLLKAPLPQDKALEGGEVGIPLGQVVLVQDLVPAPLHQAPLLTRLAAHPSPSGCLMTKTASYDGGVVEAEEAGAEAQDVGPVARPSRGPIPAQVHVR